LLGLRGQSLDISCGIREFSLSLLHDLQQQVPNSGWWHCSTADPSPDRSRVQRKIRSHRSLPSPIAPNERTDTTKEFRVIHWVKLQLERQAFTMPSVSTAVTPSPSVSAGENGFIAAPPAARRSAIADKSAAACDLLAALKIAF
jgi:hypothetical protein